MATKENVLIIGATRGLGAELLRYYASLETTSQVYGTRRGASAPSDGVAGAQYITGVDLESASCASALIAGLPKPASSHPLHTVIVSAGVFATDSLEEEQLDWEAEVRMYTVSCVAPVALVGALARHGYLGRGARLALVGSESGSVALRHAKEGGGNYGHHGSKAAVNMVARLLSLDLRDRGVAVASLHPGFMRTEMTKGVGFDKFWDDGGAVTPDVAAKSLADFVRDELDMGKTGTYWAPRGPKDIGTAEETLGKNLPTPLQLPW